MKKAVLFLLCGAFVLGLSLPSVKAVPPFKKEFDSKYVKPDGTPAEKALAAAAEGAKCNICHVGKEKKDKNAYGIELGKHLKKADAKDAEKIQKALSEVESAKSPGGKTFGELIKEGKLPGA
jgi:hypothetical protein